jgi:hypothetical protein
MSDDRRPKEHPMWHATLADPTFPACHSNLWEHINGWEVVAAVLLIMASWTTTSVARMYFMWRVAQINSSGKAD